jgi:ADP-heptose:LPS heptosyltransferase
MAGFRRKPKFNSDTIRTAQSFLFIRPEGMGDIILTLPAIAWIRKENPGARLAMAVRPMFAEWVREMRVVEEVIPLDYPKRSTLSLDQLRPFLKQVARMRRRFDVAFDFRGDPRNAVIGAWSARMVVGPGSPGTNFLLSCRYRDTELLPMAERNLRIVSVEQAAAPAIEDYASAVRYRIEDDARQRVRVLVHAKENYVLIHPGASRPDKQWAADKWRDLTGRFLESGKAVVITGAGREDSQLISTILDGLEARPTLINLVNRTSCADLTAIVDKAQLVISPDTGIAHIAFAHEVPSVTLFGADSEVLWGHETPINIPLRAPVRPQSGGADHESESDEAMNYLKAVTVEQVCSAATMVLQAASQSARSIR